VSSLKLPGGRVGRSPESPCASPPHLPTSPRASRHLLGQKLQSSAPSFSSCANGSFNV
jgi:hypothetical protein